VSERTTATRKKFEKEKKNSDAIVEVVFERERPEGLFFPS
jgi:hypothetical protein